MADFYSRPLVQEITYGNYSCYPCKSKKIKINEHLKLNFELKFSNYFLYQTKPLNPAGEK